VEPVGLETISTSEEMGPLPYPFFVNPLANFTIRDCEDMN